MSLESLDALFIAVEWLAEHWASRPPLVAARRAA